MEYALIGKMLVEGVTAAGVLLAVVLFLKDRRAARAAAQRDRAAELRDRAAERASLLKLADNAIAHNTAAVDANTRQQATATESLARLAVSIDSLGTRLAARPCLRERERAEKSLTPARQPR